MLEGIFDTNTRCDLTPWAEQNCPEYLHLLRRMDPNHKLRLSYRTTMDWRLHNEMLLYAEREGIDPVESRKLQLVDSLIVNLDIDPADVERVRHLLMLSEDELDRMDKDSR